MVVLCCAVDVLIGGLECGREVLVFWGRVDDGKGWSSICRIQL